MFNGLRLPDIEVLVRCAAFDVGVISFFAPDNIDEDWSVLVGVQSPNEVFPVVTALQEAVKALSAADWKSVSELLEDDGSEEEESPF